MRYLLEESYRDYLTLEQDLYILKYGEAELQWMNEATRLFDVKNSIGMTYVRLSSLLGVARGTVIAHHKMYNKLKEELCKQ